MERVGVVSCASKQKGRDGGRGGLAWRHVEERGDGGPSVRAVERGGSGWDWPETDVVAQNW
jgi:hypothetical protein